MTPTGGTALRQGMEHNIGLVIAKAVFGLIEERSRSFRTWCARRCSLGRAHRDGWGAGLTC